MYKGLSLNKAQRLAAGRGAKGWAAVVSLLALMCIDQFVLELPFENIVFPVLIVAAASLGGSKNVVLVLMYSFVFELSCIAWNPWDIGNVPWWLLEVIIGYFMPFIVYKSFNSRHDNLSVFSYAGLAALAELLYYWVSVAATILIWKVNPAVYILADLPYEALGCAATFVCALPVALIYKLYTGELTTRPAAARLPLGVNA